MEKDQPESTPEDPGHGWLRGYPALPAGSRIPEEGGRGDTCVKVELAGQRQLMIPWLLEEGKLPDPSCMARMLLRPRGAKWS